MSRHPTLDDLESRPDRPQDRPPRRRDNRDPETVARAGLMGSGGCWCGGESEHPWPGKSDGAPHPRQPRGHTWTGKAAE